MSTTDTFIIPPVNAQTTEKSDSSQPKKKSGKGKWIILIGLVILIISLPIGVYYFSQQQAVTDTRSRAAAGTCRNIVPNPSGSNCFEVKCNTATNATACSNTKDDIGTNCCQWYTSVISTPTPGVGWVCNNTNCQGDNCSARGLVCAGSYPNPCECVQGSGGGGGGTALPTATPTPGAAWSCTNTNCQNDNCSTRGLVCAGSYPNPCECVCPPDRPNCGGSGSTPTPTTAPTSEPTAEPTAEPTNPPSEPGTCDASCQTDANCTSGLSCASVNGVNRCRDAACPAESSCSCDVAAIGGEDVTDVSGQEMPVSGVGPGILGSITVIGSILLLVVGLIL